MAQWIKNYQQQCAGATINYQANGSGAGQQAFIAGTADFAGSDSPLAPADQPSANSHCSTGPAIHLPMVVGPIAVVTNVSGASSLQFKPATLAGIFAGKITKWNDPAIAADNPGVTLPATAITAVHRADSSGTTRQLHQVPDRDRADRVDLRPRQGVEGSGRRRGDTVLTASPRRSRRPMARSATSSGRSRH